METIVINLPAESIADLCRRYGVRELSLFGSVLRDDFRPDSDVDFLVRFEPDAKIGLIKYHELQEELALIVGRKVDLVSKDWLNPVIRDEVIRSSRVVYASE
jgi:uncharacterized protein